MSDFVLARRLHALGSRPERAGWHELVDRLHAAVPLSRAALRVVCEVSCPAETRRVDLIALLRANGGPVAEARLLRYLEDSAPTVVAAAVRALAAVGGVRSVVALAGVPDSERARERIKARIGAVAGEVSLVVADERGRLSH